MIVVAAQAGDRDGTGLAIGPAVIVGLMRVPDRQLYRIRCEI